MKKYLLILVPFSTVLSSTAQQSSNKQLLEPVNKRYNVYVELKKNQAIVYNLRSWWDKGGTGYRISEVDTIEQEASTPGIVFATQHTTLEKEKNRLHLTFRDANLGKQKRIELKETANEKQVNYKINNAYWWDNFMPLTKEIAQKLSWDHYSFRNGFTFWKLLPHKDMNHQDFKAYANQELKRIADSVVHFEMRYTLLSTDVIKNISTIPYDALRDSVAILRTQVSNSYLEQVITAVAKERPELFFKLGEDLPDRRVYFYHAVDSDTKAIKRLKTANASAESKSDFVYYLKSL